jgi:hypothetical protein
MPPAACSLVVLQQQQDDVCQHLQDTGRVVAFSHQCMAEHPQAPHAQDDANIRAQQATGRI